MAWFEADGWTPRDGEKVLFHCKKWIKTSWEIGRYCRGDNKIYNHYVGRTYISYDFEDVDWWYKVPEIPLKKNKKTNAV